MAIKNNNKMQLSTTNNYILIKVSLWLSWYGGFLYRWQTAGGGSIPR